MALHLHRFLIAPVLLYCYLMLRMYLMQLLKGNKRRLYCRKHPMKTFTHAINIFMSVFQSECGRKVEYCNNTDDTSEASILFLVLRLISFCFVLCALETYVCCVYHRGRVRLVPVARRWDLRQTQCRLAECFTSQPTPRMRTVEFNL